ncbi:MAG TPA: flippase [Thermoleophilaceae bacterium]|nr:flippase [Thermoleophilaceae bacterium]
MSPAGPARPATLGRRVVHNTSVQLAGKLAVMAVGVASIAITTRYLGVAGYGRMALALTFLQTFGVLADAGLLTVTVREISRRPERASELVSTTLLLRLALSLVVLVVAVLVSLVLPYDRTVRLAIVIAGAPFVLGLLSGSIVAVFQARLAMTKPVIADVTGRVCTFLALVAAVLADLGFYVVVATTGVGAAVTLALIWFFSRDVVTIRPSWDWARVRPLVVAAIPVGLTLAVNEIYFRADTVLISLFRDFEDVGAYSLAYRVVELVGVFPAIVMTSVFPLMSRYLTENRELAVRTIDATADLFTALGLAVAVGGAILAPQIVELAGGQSFEHAADPLRLLFTGAPLAAISGLLGFMLIAAGRQRSALNLGLMALALNLALNVALVPSLGIVAAAATAVASDLFLLAGGLVLARRHLGITPRFSILPRAALAAAAMGVPMLILQDVSILLLAPAGAAVFLGVLYLVGGLDRTKLEALRP